MRFSLNNFLTSLFLVIFSMLLVNSIQDGNTLFIIINVLFIVVDILTLSFVNRK